MPLNQNGCPAASFTPLTIPPGTNNGRSPWPLGREVDRVEPVSLCDFLSQTTVSPTLIVTRLIRKLLMPAPYLLPRLFDYLTGPPGYTVFVFAAAPAGRAAGAEAAQAKAQTPVLFFITPQEICLTRAPYYA